MASGGRRPAVVLGFQGTSFKVELTAPRVAELKKMISRKGAKAQSTKR